VEHTLTFLRKLFVHYIYLKALVASIMRMNSSVHTFPTFTRTKIILGIDVCSDFFLDLPIIKAFTNRCVEEVTVFVEAAVHWFTESKSFMRVAIEQVTSSREAFTFGPSSLTFLCHHLSIRILAFCEISCQCFSSNYLALLFLWNECFLEVIGRVLSHFQISKEHLIVV